MFQRLIKGWNAFLFLMYFLERKNFEIESQKQKKVKRAFKMSNSKINFNFLVKENSKFDLNF
jgi:hypothetical protein